VRAAVLYVKIVALVNVVDMGLDKAIEQGKEHREPYRKAKAVNSTCRNHGSCPWCAGNRQINSRRKAQKTSEEIKQYRSADL